MRVAARFGLLLLLLFAPARLDAGSPPTRTQILLLECPSASALRGRLETYADSCGLSDAYGAGEACSVLGASFARTGERDSAIAWYSRANRILDGPQERLALVDLLLERRAGEDVARAATLLRISLEGIEAPGARLPYQARQAWALHLAARSDSAARLFAEIETPLSASLEWSDRMGRVAVAAGRPGAAMRWLSPVAVASRGCAPDVMAALSAAAASSGTRRDLSSLIAAQVTALDRSEAARLDALSARPVSFDADDGFPLAGAVLAPGDGVRRVGAVVLVEPDERASSCDSLADVLRRANLAVLLLERRGTGGSIGPTCALPFAWRGREDALDRRCARDVRGALRVLAGMTRLDTSRCVVVGVGETATTAVRAAGLDPRTRALVLVSPAPHPVDGGTVRAGIAALQRPIFFQIAPEDFPLFEQTDIFYQAGVRGRSRVSDARGAGQGAAQFHHDPTIAPRLIRWLAETMSAPAPPTLRPSRPRRK